MFDIVINILVGYVLESNDNFVHFHKMHFIFVQYTLPILLQVSFCFKLTCIYCNVF